MKNSLLSSSRARRLGAVLALLVGSVAVIATSPPDTWHVSTSFMVDPTELPASAPQVERRLKLSVTLSEPSEKALFGGLNIEVFATWKPSVGSVAPGKPWVRARLFQEMEGGELEVVSKVLILDEAEVPRSLSLQAPGFSKPCVRETRCEGVFRLELERQAEPLGGVVTVQWQATANIRGGDDELEPPPGITVILSEP